ncbi:MAG: hypothetical protein IPM82_23290 [Saprospiraceae bacterium]|nr:hypothetical protein [Saprospiraceae bacterium]
MQNLAIKYGLVMFGSFIAFFLLAYLFGIAQYHEFRLLNGVIHMTILYLLIRAYRRAFPETLDNYVSGVAVGMVASTIGVLAFTVFVFLFLESAPTLLAQLRERSPMPELLTPFNAAVYISVEGIVVSLIGGYIITRVVDARYDHSPAEGKVSKSMTGN